MANFRISGKLIYDWTYYYQNTLGNKNLVDRNLRFK